MRIGFLLESLDIEAGGPARVAGMVASGLVKRGHCVSIATLPTLGERVEIHPDAQVIYLSGPRHNPLNWIVAAYTLSKLTQKIDVLFISGIWGPVDGLARRLAAIRNIPVHTRICGMLESFILERHPIRKWLARKAYVNYNLSRSASLIVNTEIEATHVRRLGFKTAIRVIPNGVCVPQDSDRLPRETALRQLGLNISQDARLILYLSRIHPKKCLHILLKALSSVFHHHPKWVLIVAGDFYHGEGYENRVRLMVSESGFADRIYFTGHVAGIRKSAALSIADLFVLPSISEGFSNSVIEALAWGVPVVITNGCNFPEVMACGAGWVCESNAESLSAVLGQVFSAEGFQVESHNARILVQAKYQQDHVLDLYEDAAMSHSDSHKSVI